MQLRRILIGIGLLVVGAAWYAFRPERLFLDDYVNEPLDAATVDDHQAELVGRGLVPAPVFAVLRTGRFQSGAHETEGVATVHDLGGGRRCSSVDSASGGRRRTSKQTPSWCWLWVSLSRSGVATTR